MLSILLAKEIFKLFLIMFISLAATKAGLLKADDASALSRISLYFIVPCILLTAYQVDFTVQVRNGLIISVAFGLLAHIIFIGCTRLLKRPLRLDEVERASVIYTNCGNLLIPLVAAVLGPEWVIFTIGYCTVQTVFLWTHCFSMFAGKGQASLKKILTNVNLITLPFGLFFLFTGFRLPEIINTPMESVGDMVGPVAMIINGMLMSKLSLRDIFCQKRIYLSFLLRMIIFPAVILLIIKLFHLDTILPDSSEVLMIVLLCTAAPAASTVTQFAQLYDKEASYASAINVMTTLSCIVTLPVFVQIYFM